MDKVWEELHASREWGKYPSIDLVKAVMKEFKNKDRSQLSVLEVGCGAGANLHFFLNEGFRVYGIDGSTSAIENAKKRLGAVAPIDNVELVPGDFESLPFENEVFDIVVDNLSVYANPLKTISNTYKEMYRVLKTAGFCYSRAWGDETLGAGSGEMQEPGTSMSPVSGPCKGMGTSHFFKRQEFLSYFKTYREYNLRRLVEQHFDNDFYTEEWVIWAKK